MGIVLALDFDLSLDEDQALAHHLEVALDLDRDLAPVNLCNGATGCCGTGMFTPGGSGEYAGASGDHMYLIFDPSNNSLETQTWDYWSQYCQSLNVGDGASSN